jgi:hypothetical protein
MTTALERNEESASRPRRSLPPGKTSYSLYRRLGGPQGRSGQVRKISPPLGFDARTVQPVASRYTDWATGPTKVVGHDKYKFKRLGLILRKVTNKYNWTSLPIWLYCYCIRSYVITKASNKPVSIFCSDSDQPSLLLYYNFKVMYHSSYYTDSSDAQRLTLFHNNKITYQM